MGELPAAILFACPALTPEEMLAMRADLAMYTLQGRADFKRRFAPGVGGGEDAGRPTMQRMPDGTIHQRITNWADLDAAMKPRGGKL